MISPKQRPLPDNTQHSQETDINVPGGIRTRNSRKRPAVNARLRKRGHWPGSIYPPHFFHLQRETVLVRSNLVWQGPCRLVNNYLPFQVSQCSRCQDQAALEYFNLNTRQNDVRRSVNLYQLPVDTARHYHSHQSTQHIITTVTSRHSTSLPQLLVDTAHHYHSYSRHSTSLP
jgi:uncharacterized protein YjlB